MKIRLLSFLVPLLLLISFFYPKKVLAGDVIDYFNDSSVNWSTWRMYDLLVPANEYPWDTYDRFTCVYCGVDCPCATCWQPCKVNCVDIGSDVVEEVGNGDGGSTPGRLRLYRNPNCSHRFTYLQSRTGMNSSFYDATARVRLINQQGWGVGWGIGDLLSIWYPNDYTNANAAWRKPDGNWDGLLLPAGDANWHKFRFRHELLSSTSSRFWVWLDDVLRPGYPINYSFSTPPAPVSGKVWFGNLITGQCEGWNSCDNYSTGAGPWPRLEADYVDIRSLPATWNDPPSCSSLTVPATIQRGETVSIEITGADPEGRLDRIEAYYSPTSSQSWTLIGSQGCSGSSCTRTFSWNTTPVADGDYYVVGNVYDTDGGKCSGNPWTPLPSGWSSCPNCRKTVIVFTPRTWTIQYEAVCTNGMEPTGQTRSVYGLWPPNPLVWHYGSYGDAGAVRSQTITNEHPWNNIYFWMQNQSEQALPLYGSPPHSAIKYGTYFSPPTPMAEWKWNALPEGTYKINFLAPESWCPTGSITGKIWNDGSNVGGACEKVVSGEPAYTGGEAMVTYWPCSTSCTTVSDSSGNYRFENVPIGGYQVSASFPSGSSWFVTSDNPCPANIEAAGDVETANFGVSNNPLSWFQGVNGDIYGNGISVRVPTDPPGTAPGYYRWFLDAAPATTSGGVVISGSTDNPSCGGGGAGRCSRRPNETEPGWRVKDEPMGWPSLPSLTSVGSPPWNSLEPGKVYSRSAPLNPPNHYNLTGEGVAVIRVQGGNLNFTTNYFCAGPLPNPCDSGMWRTKGLIFVVENGNVIINQNVRRIDALILVVSGTIRVEGTSVANNLTVYGMLYTQNNINFARTLENNRVPAVVVQYNPLYFHRTNPLAKPQISWREIAP